jgi:hypothetical protein
MNISVRENAVGMTDLDGFLAIWDPMGNIGRTYLTLVQNWTTSVCLGSISHRSSLTSRKPTS